MLDKYNGVVFVDDPCSQVADLVNCSGVLAIGGAHISGTHLFDDQTWSTLAYPFVVMNNGLDTCHCAEYNTVLTHELTHTMGIGHISSTHGPANMNPSCCSDITDLDLQCVDYTYPDSNNINVFTGIGNQWLDPSNWSLNIVPLPRHAVVIPVNKNVILNGIGTG